MTIQLTFSPVLADYAARRYPIIRNLEEPGGRVSLAPYADSIGLATVGAGFLVRANAREILATMLARVITNDEVTTLENAVKDGNNNRIFANNAAAQTALDTAYRTITGNQNATFSFATEAAVESAFNLIADKNERRVNGWLPNIPQTTERLVFLSLAYNNIVGPGQSGALRQAILDGDRAEAWGTPGVRVKLFSADNNLI